MRTRTLPQCSRITAEREREKRSLNLRSTFTLPRRDSRQALLARLRRQQERHGTDSPIGSTEGTCKAHRQPTPRIEATLPKHRVVSLAERDQEAGERELARQSRKEQMPSAFVKAACKKVVLETYRKALETQLDVDKVEPRNLEDEVLAFNRNRTSGTAPMDMGNIAPGQPQVPGVGRSSQNVSSCLNGWVDNYPDLNNYEHGSHWRQDHFGDNGDVDVSGGLNGELYGLQKEKGAKGKGVSFDDICFNCVEPRQGIRQSSVSQKVVRPKDRDGAKRETVKVRMMERAGQLAKDGQMGKVRIIWAKVGISTGQQD